MRYFLLLIGLVCLIGCDSPVIKTEYMSLERLKKSKKFVGYEVVIGPLNLAKLKSNKELGIERVISEEKFDPVPDEKRFFIPDDWAEQPELKIQGPFRLTRDINATIKSEGKDRLHRRVKLDEKYYYFELQDVLGYGFQFLSVKNEANETGVILLKSVGKTN